MSPCERRLGVPPVLGPLSRAGQARIYLSGTRWEAIFTTCVLSSVSHASTPLASASDRPSLTAASCVGDVACGALGTTLISCSRTAVECETRTSPGFRSDKDCGFVSFGTIAVWPGLTIGAVPFRTSRADCSAEELRRFA
jgi:hypothetical protein